METEKYTNTIHLGRKIERVRRLRGMTQAELGDLLGITKQAVSKIEQTEKFDDERLRNNEDYHKIIKQRWYRVNKFIYALCRVYALQRAFLREQR